LKIQMCNLTVQFLAMTFLITRLLIHSYTLWYLRNPEIIILLHVQPTRM